MQMERERALIWGDWNRLLGAMLCSNYSVVDRLQYCFLVVEAFSQIVGVRWDTKDPNGTHPISHVEEHPQAGDNCSGGACTTSAVMYK